MRVKPRVEARRAQLAESAALLLAVAWATWLASRFYYDATQEHDDDAARARKTDEQDTLLLGLLPRVLHALNAVAFAAVARALLSARAVPKAMEELSRQEHNSGLAVGCILPPLVLLSRFLAIAYGDTPSVSGPTLLYVWIAVTASASLLIKIVCFGSAGVLPTAIVDAVVLPAVCSHVGVESDFRFVLPTIGRIAIAVAFRFGRLALRRSFTVGEALIVAQGVGIGMLDLLLVTALKLGDESSSLPDRAVAAWHLHASPMMEREPHQLALQVGVVGALLVCVALTPLLSGHGSPSPHVVAAPLPPLATAQFLVTAVVVLGGVVYPWASILLDTWNPVAWLAQFLIEKPLRWQLLMFWVGCLVVCVPAFAVISKAFALRQIIARKLFHVLVVVMFVPAYFLSPEMLSLSYGVALAGFCLAECVRAVSLPPLGQSIAEFVKPFIDHREGGRVILTHTYLLLGCALPLWLAHSTAPTNALASNAGVVALGVGDAMGAAIGSTFGKRRIFGTKTLEGTTAVMVSMTLASLALHAFHGQALTDGALTQLMLLLIGTTLTSLLEAATTQIDNLVLSLYLFTIANLIACHA